jgi:hypothetical protein
MLGAPLSGAGVRLFLLWDGHGAMRLARSTTATVSAAASGSVEAQP